jgi:phenylalanyl-tRNA synthetase beta chain
MNVSHEWLKAFVPHGLPPERVRDLITAHAATVEGMERLRADLEPFVVGQVIESQRIPDTKLSFNKVDDGTGEFLEVVCGAPNVTVGAKYPFARTGTHMPGGLVIEKRKIRGFTSNGMLCSARELGLGEDHDGIYTLDTAAANGTPLLDVLPLGDVRFVVDVLPNRPDLLSHAGVARDVAAVSGVAMTMPDELAGIPAAPAAVSGATEASAGSVTVAIEDAADCPRYCAAVIRGVRVGPSPDWLRRRVESVGGRSINNVVDATNYILHGFGQPVHAFDLAKVGGSRIVVRRARTGEMLTTLDGVARTLTPAMLVIADATAATAVAGVMGGQHSEVTDATTDVLLEVATFGAKVVRAGRRALGLSTDASYRYERGVDDAGVPRIAEIAAGLIAMVAGGRVETMLAVGSAPAARGAVVLDPARVPGLLGDAVPADEVRTLLEAVGFGVAPDGAMFRVTPPSWRHDVSRDVDLVEEVARLRGYDRLPDTLTGARPGTVPDHPLYTLTGRIRDALVARGLYEVRPSPYIAPAVAGTTPHVRVQNPLADDEPFLRSSVLQTLASRAEHNLARMQGDVRIFETGTAFIAASNGVKEEWRVGALVMGLRRPRHFTEPAPPAMDAWDAKGIAEAIAAVAWPAARIVMQPGEGVLWTVMVDGTARGVVRDVALDAPVWASPAFGVEITLGKMPAAPVAPRGAHDYAATGAPPERRAVRYTPLPTTPAAEFDLALVVPDAVPAAEVERLIRVTSGELLESVVVFDEYRGEHVPAGTRSLAWRLTFRHPERTLRDKEIEGRRAQLLRTLEKEIGVVVRTG